MKLIELHLLQSFPFTCLNRDAVGSPKTAYFGGVQRARVSSQCWKRAIRTFASREASNDEKSPNYFAGERGHLHTETLGKRLEELGVPPKEANGYAFSVLTKLCKSDKKKDSKEGKKAGKGDKQQKKEGQTPTALYLTPLEIDVIARTIFEEWNSSDKDGKKVYKINNDNQGKIVRAVQEARREDFGDIAIFGRMVAGTPELTLEGAALFSHALSTHEIANEIDFFSAVDDTKQDDGAGAGHIGWLEANSACYYRYIGLNLDLLFGTGDPEKQHLQKLNFDDKRKVLKIFLTAVMKAIPGARENSMFGASLPQYATAFVRSGQPLSLVNAFEVPVKVSKCGGYVKPSYEAFVNHYKELNRVYKFFEESEKYDLTVDENAENVGTNTKRTFDEWLEEIVDAAVKDYK